MSIALTFARREGIHRGFYPVKIMRRFTMLAANLLSTAVDLVASPPEEQEDHAQRGKLLQDAGADGQHRRSSDVVVIENRVSERDGIEDRSGYDRGVEEGRVRVVQLAPRAQRHDDQRSDRR